jgi:hypothetical protein
MKQYNWIVGGWVGDSAEHCLHGTLCCLIVYDVILVMKCWNAKKQSIARRQRHTQADLQSNTSNGEKPTTLYTKSYKIHTVKFIPAALQHGPSDGASWFQLPCAWTLKLGPTASLQHPPLRSFWGMTKRVGSWEAAHSYNMGIPLLCM